MSYANFDIIRPLYSLQKKISSLSLKVGDRFIYKGHESLVFKTNVEPIDGKYLCCDEQGFTEWIDGQENVIKINGIVMTLNSISQKFKYEYLKNKK